MSVTLYNSTVVNNNYRALTVSENFIEIFNQRKHLFPMIIYIRYFPRLIFADNVVELLQESPFIIRCIQRNGKYFFWGSVCFDLSA